MNIYERDKLKTKKKIRYYKQGSSILKFKQYIIYLPKYVLLRRYKPNSFWPNPIMLSSPAVNTAWHFPLTRMAGKEKVVNAIIAASF